MNDKVVAVTQWSALGDVQRQAEIVEQEAWIDFFEAAPSTVRNDLGLSHARMDGMGLLACPAIPIAELNRAIAIGSDRLPSRRALGDTIDWLDRHAARGWAIQLGAPEKVSAANGVLAGFNLGADSVWTKFVRLLSEPGHDCSGPAEVDGVNAHLFGSIVQTGFGLPLATADWFAALVGRRGWKCFLRFVDGQPAGAASLYVRGRAAWAGMATTLPAFRNRGVQGSLVAARCNAAAIAGARIITSETGQSPADPSTGGSSYRNQGRAGFSKVYERANLRQL